jgi:hypothetical protein
VNVHMILMIACLVALIRFWRLTLAVALCGIAVIFALGLAAGLSHFGH